MQKSRPVVAVVDDEESVRKALSRLFAASNVDCLVFASGREFLDSLKVRVPSCVILDLHMPGLTGLDVQRELARSGAKVPAIIVTAYDEPGKRAQCLSEGAADYLRKPIEEKTLLDAVAHVVGRGLPAYQSGS
jgi:FixJ family two-component response regulator